MGAFHGSEVPFVWGAEFELTGAAEVALSKKMVRYWSNFAKSGSPNGEKTGAGAQADSGAERDPRATADAARDLPHWPRLVTNVSDGMIRLATGDWRPYTSDFDRANVSAVEALRKRECDFWDAVNGFVVDPIPLAPPRRESDDRSPAGSGNVAVATARALRAEGEVDEREETASSSAASSSSPLTTIAARWTTAASGRGAGRTPRRECPLRAPTLARVL